MSKSLNKLFLLPLALCISFSTLSACSSDNKQNKYTQSLTELAAKGKDLKEATVTFYFRGTEHKDSREVLEALGIKLKTDLNTKIVFQWINADTSSYFNQIKTLIASGSPCDAFQYHSNGDPALPLLSSLASEGLLMDITKLFPQNAPGYNKRLSKEELNSATVDGKLLGVPNHNPTANRMCALVREDLMRKYKIPDIKSYDDFEGYLQTVKEKEPDMIPLSMFDTAIGLFAESLGYVIMDYEIGLVYKHDDPQMKLMAWEQTPEYRKCIERINRWYTNGYILKNNIFTPADEDIITTGKFASIINVQGSEERFNILARAKNGNSWSYKEYPLYPDKPSERNTPSEITLFNAKSANVERALLFIDWLHSKQDNYDLMMYGIKGKHYELNKDQVSLPKATKPRDAYAVWNGRNVFSNIDLERISTASSPEYRKAYLDSVINKSKYVPHQGFRPDFGSVEKIAMNRRMSFFSIESEIGNGSFSSQRIDEYIKKQKDEGIDNLVAVVQKQLDTWKSKK